MIGAVMFGVFFLTAHLCCWLLIPVVAAKAEREIFWMVAAIATFLQIFIGWLSYEVLPATPLGNLPALPRAGWLFLLFAAMASTTFLLGRERRPKPQREI